MTEPERILYTIGHSNHGLDHFVGLLRQHSIEVLADVRSAPWSRYTPHFNSESLKHSLPGHGIQYLFLGQQLGGRPDDSAMYDPAGHVLYGRVAETTWFRDGIERLQDGLGSARVAIMCSEEDPAVCHRFLLVTRVMSGQGMEIRHIRGDGSVWSEERVRQTSRDSRDQGMLFGEMEQDIWKSLRSVLPKAPPPDSLGD